MDIVYIILMVLGMGYLFIVDYIKFKNSNFTAYSPLDPGENKPFDIKRF